ncbi:hypothetical protein T484DRAFT_1939985, partial [Baffinella frigidus]
MREAGRSAAHRRRALWRLLPPVGGLFGQQLAQEVHAIHADIPLRLFVRLHHPVEDVLNRPSPQDPDSRTATGRPCAASGKTTPRKYRLSPITGVRPVSAERGSACGIEWVGNRLQARGAEHDPGETQPTRRSERGPRFRGIFVGT